MALIEASLEGPVVGVPKLVPTANLVPLPVPRPAGLPAMLMDVTMSVVGVNVVIPLVMIDPDVPPPNPDEPNSNRAVMLVPMRTPKGRIDQVTLTNGVIKLDGRTLVGFDGATAIVEGLFDTNKNILIATSVEIEPAENLLLGAVTAVNAAPGQQTLAINGVPVRKIQNGLGMNFDGYVNEFGFRVTLVNGLLNTVAAASGYFSDGLFYAHTVEVDALASLLPNQPMVSLTRVRTRRREGGPATLDIRGGVDFSRLGNIGPVATVNIFRVAIDPLDPRNANKDIPPDVLIGVEQATRDVGFPNFGLWRLQGPLTQPDEGRRLGQPFPLTAPRKIRVVPAVTGIDPTPNDVVADEADIRF